MIILGLTGSIGMGKSETARMFQRLDVPVYDSDAAVHALYAAGGAAVRPIGEMFADAIVNDAVDRQILGAHVLGHPDRLKQLERIVHPLVGQAQMAFLEKARAQNAPLVVLDIPLLFETGGNGRVDKVLVVSCPPELQRARVLARPGMSEKKLDAILAKQMPDAEKRARADFVIETDGGLDKAFADVKNLIDRLTGSSSVQGTNHA
jgi:dephospho-CoA kinase